MQNLNNIEKWEDLTEGEALVLEGTRRRRITLHVNAPHEANLYLVETGKDGADKGRFLCKVCGLDVVRWTAQGVQKIVSDVPLVKVYTGELEKTSMASPDPTVFTKIAERRQRNPQLELMMRTMRQNTEALLSAQAAEMDRRFAQVKADQKAALEAAQAAQAAPATQEEGNAVNNAPNADGSTSADATAADTSEPGVAPGAADA